MDFNVKHAIDNFKEGTMELADTAHEKTSQFHENYVSPYLPDCGKYGDAAKFAAELLPGVAEYNAIAEGDWQAFALSAGIDLAALGIGIITAGAGYAAVKSGTTAAKTGLKAAAKEAAEAGIKKAGKEAAEAGLKKAGKEAAEAGAEKLVKEAVEAGAEKAAKEVVEAGAEKAAKEAVEAGAEKAAKEAVEAGTEKSAKEAVEAGAEKTAKEVKEISQVLQNKLDGLAKEKKVFEDLISEFGEENVLKEAYIRDKAGNIIRDVVTKEGRRIDFVVKEGDRIIKSIEVTSETASKVAQVAKEQRILQQALETGGAFIKDTSGELLKFPADLMTEIVRLK